MQGAGVSSMNAGIGTSHERIKPVLSKAPFAVIASVAKQSRTARDALDCFATLAMTELGQPETVPSKRLALPHEEVCSRRGAENAEVSLTGSIGRPIPIGQKAGKADIRMQPSASSAPLREYPSSSCDQR